MCIRAPPRAVPSEALALSPWSIIFGPSDPPTGNALLYVSKAISEASAAVHS